MTRRPPDTLPTTAVAGLATCEIGAADAPLLQRFFDENPAYFMAVQGEPAGPTEARDEIASLPPAGWPFTRKWLIGYVEADGRLAAVAHVITDLFVPGVWHVGLFVVASSRHGRGDAQALAGELESWARESGAEWLRLGVVEGNVRARRFWDSRGYRPLRTRGGVVMGSRTNVVCTMVKPLAGGDLARYLDLVARDRPDVARG
jgi:GNAT superfamily N-acetyltransferase